MFYFISISFSFVYGTVEPANPCNASVLRNYGNLPLYFIENKGQLDPSVRFYARTASQTLYLTADGIIFDLFRKKKILRVMDRKGMEIRNRYRHTKEETERLVEYEYTDVTID